MCGIFCHVGKDQLQTLPEKHAHLLRRRGPDSLQCHSIRAGAYWIHLAASVLSLRGSDVTKQPLIDEVTGSALCWNGEAWKISGNEVKGNDSVAVFDLLLKASSSCPDSSHARILQALSEVRGPFALVYYDAPRQRIYFGRDCLGRRSLLFQKGSGPSFTLSSVGDPSSDDGWSEVEADGIYVLCLQQDEDELNTSSFSPIHFPLAHVQDGEQNQLCLASLPFYSLISTKSLQRMPYPKLNHSQPADLAVPRMTLQSSHLSKLEALLIKSLDLRVKNLPGTDDHPIAILFSGGLDCTLLAYYCHIVLRAETPVDLINVAFQNPRVHKDAAKDPFSQCPDRITGQAAWESLCKLCPTRQYRLVCVNVPYEQYQREISTIKSLMYPHNTEMDLSIASALYFAAKATGTIHHHHLSPNTTHAAEYTSPSRILLSGLGADELFAGYSRHAIAFQRRGFSGLLAELDLDFTRLGRRNLGRDDRVTSHWAREVRYPFLDEDVVDWAVRAPVWEKCGFGMGQPGREDPDIEPGKLALRLLAWKVGLEGVAVEKKRAIQFGSRTAKMHSGKSNGTDILS